MASSRLCVVVWLVLAGLLAIQAMAESHDSDSDADPAVQLGDDHQTRSFSGGEADRPVSSESGGKEDHDDEAEAVAQPPEGRRLGKHRSDKSVAGGGVIIGGLVTAIFAAVFCYIRVTRKRNSVL